MAIKTCIGSYCSEKNGSLSTCLHLLSDKKSMRYKSSKYTLRLIIDSESNKLVEDSFVNSKPSLDCKSKDMIGTAFQKELYSIEQL